MRRTMALGFATLVALGCAGAPGCLGLDDYQLVPPGSLVGGGGTGTGTGTGIEGGGGTGGLPDSCTETAGTVFVSVPIEPGATALPCSPTPAAAGGLAIYAFDPSGQCVAHDTIERAGGSTSTGAIRIDHRTDDLTHVAGTFRDGSLALPERCSDDSPVQLDLPPGAVEALFVATLRVHGGQTGALCTDWARTAGATVLGALRVSALEADESGTVTIAGSLGGAEVTFSDEQSTSSIQGSAFVARYTSSGLLDGQVAFQGGAFDDVLGLDHVGSRWLATGALLYEQPSCLACTGTCNVLGAAAACVGAGGSGGAAGSGGSAGSGGTAGAGGAAGAAGAGGAAGAPPGDGTNAFMWRSPTTALECERLDSFGSDLEGSGDAQAGFDVATRWNAGTCQAYWTGLAGRGTWTFDAADPSSALFDSGGTIADGFVAKLSGTDFDECALGAQYAWNVRLTPSAQGAVLWGNRVAARACAEGSVLTAFVTGAPLGMVSLHRCAQSSGCAPTGVDFQLVDAPSQLLVIGLDTDGSLAWHGVLGPTDAGSFAVGGAVMGEVRDDLKLDNRDHVWLLVQTTGPFTTSNVTTTMCPELATWTDPGTFVVGLSPNGSNGQADCEHAVQLGP